MGSKKFKITALDRYVGSNLNATPDLGLIQVVQAVSPKSSSLHVVKDVFEFFLSHIQESAMFPFLFARDRDGQLRFLCNCCSLDINGVHSLTQYYIPSTDLGTGDSQVIKPLSYSVETEGCLMCHM